MNEIAQAAIMIGAVLVLWACVIAFMVGRGDDDFDDRDPYQ